MREHDIRYLDPGLFISEYKEIIIVLIIKPTYTRQNETNKKKTNKIKKQNFRFRNSYIFISFFLIVITKVIQLLSLQLSHGIMNLTNKLFLIT